MTQGGGSTPVSGSNPPATRRRRGPRRWCGSQNAHRARARLFLGSLESSCRRASSGGGGRAYGGRSQQRRASPRRPEFGRARVRSCSGRGDAGVAPTASAWCGERFGLAGATIWSPELRRRRAQAATVTVIGEAAATAGKRANGEGEEEQQLAAVSVGLMASSGMH